MKFAGDFLLGQTFVRNDKNSLLSRGGLQFEMTWHRGTKFHQRKNYEKFTEDIDQVEETEKSKTVLKFSFIASFQELE